MDAKLASPRKAVHAASRDFEPGCENRGGLPRNVPQRIHRARRNRPPSWQWGKSIGGRACPSRRALRLCPWCYACLRGSSLCGPGIWGRQQAARRLLNRHFARNAERKAQIRAMLRVPGSAFGREVDFWRSRTDPAGSGPPAYASQPRAPPETRSIARIPSPEHPLSNNVPAEQSLGGPWSAPELDDPTPRSAPKRSRKEFHSWENVTQPQVKQGALQNGAPFGPPPPRRTSPCKSQGHS